MGVEEREFKETVLAALSVTPAPDFAVNAHLQAVILPLMHHIRISIRRCTRRQLPSCKRDLKVSRSYGTFATVMA